MSGPKSSAEAFNLDVANNNGYLYTTNASLSSFLANKYQTDAALAMVSWRDKKVLDVGCGDGTYTFDLFDRGRPFSLTGLDPAVEAINLAKQRAANRRITFEIGSAADLGYPNDSFDLVHLRGVLHHMDEPIKALREALRVAPIVIVIEPNGYNPILKLIERLSPYHRKHGERSYTANTLFGWARDQGGKIQQQKYMGLVPFFCPDYLARLLKFIEPIVEATPLVRSLLCATNLFVVVRDKK